MLENGGGGGGAILERQVEQLIYSNGTLPLLLPLKLKLDTPLDARCTLKDFFVKNMTFIQQHELLFTLLLD